jgi:hypothetical protein
MLQLAKLLSLKAKNNYQLKYQKSNYFNKTGEEMSEQICCLDLNTVKNLSFSIPYIFGFDQVFDKTTTIFSTCNVNF